MKKKFNCQIGGASELFLSYYLVESDDDVDDEVIKVPISSLITIFAIKMAEKMDGEPLANIKIYFKPEPFLQNEGAAVSLNRNCLSEFSILAKGQSVNNVLIDSCVLPAIHVPEIKLCVTGLCSVLRRLLKTVADNPQKPSVSLLGYQGSCLSAPAEVSSWTRFCEIDLPEMTSRFALPEAETDEIELPVDLARFEEHMKQPVRMHNIRKRMGKAAAAAEKGSVTSHQVLNNGRQVALDEDGKEVDPINIYARTQHVFAEGPDPLLSDLVVFPSLYLVLEQLFKVYDLKDLEEVAPSTFNWFAKMQERYSADVTMKSLTSSDLDFRRISLSNPPNRRKSSLKMPKVPSHSLYKSDPKRSNPAAKIFTRQHEIERILDQVGQLKQLQLFSSNLSEDVASVPGNGTTIDWSSLPSDVHPLGGELPLCRIEKKCHQLENMTSAVLKLAKDGDTVVDFCSGGGHLGIVIAYLVPSATVILVENKEESLMRAILRVQRLGLSNCRFFQGNLDYFTGKFDVGVSLHACGVATDLVMKACIANKASFVSCPCCYGSVQENHILEYPRSQHFRSMKFSFKDYLILGHTADQTHVTNDKHGQGLFCMDFVDSDRVHLAKESGYSSVILTKMKPENCSPKNNLIIATFAK